MEDMANKTVQTKQKGEMETYKKETDGSGFG